MKERKIRFNFIDVLIILVIAAVVFAVLYVFVLGDRKTEVVPDESTTKITYVIQLTNIDERYDGLIKAGDPVEEAVKRQMIGTVTGVQSEPFQKVTFDYDSGRETVSALEGKILMNVTVEADAVESDKAFTVGGCEIRVGQLYSLALPDMYISGYCIRLDADSAE